MPARKEIWNCMAVPSVEMRVQTYHDVWRQQDRVMRYQGRCVVCSRPTWAFDDGANDPRGPLGDNALWVTLTDPDEHEIRTCAVCANDEPSYRRALALAFELGWRAVAPASYIDDMDEQQRDLDLRVTYRSDAETP